MKLKQFDSSNLKFLKKMCVLSISELLLFLGNRNPKTKKSDYDYDYDCHKSYQAIRLATGLSIPNLDYLIGLPI
jgi:hypothetical protein